LAKLTSKGFLSFWFFNFPLSRAEHPVCGRKRRGDCLSRTAALAKAGRVSARPPADGTRRVKRDTGVFFHVKENEESIFNKAPRIDTSLGYPHEAQKLYQRQYIVKKKA